MDECQIYYTLGVGTGPPPTAINPGVRPLGTYETLKISGLYSLLAFEGVNYQRTSGKAACLFEEHAKTFHAVANTPLQSGPAVPTFMANSYFLRQFLPYPPP